MSAMTYAKRSKYEKSSEASISHWAMELIQADEELRQLERKQALRSMSMLMRHDEIRSDECGAITNSNPAPPT